MAEAKRPSAGRRVGGVALMLLGAALILRRIRLTGA